MEPLGVDVVHFYPKENSQTHNTAKYEVVNDENPTIAIVRRGQPFNGVVRFTRPYDEENDLVQLVFSLGDKPGMDTQGSVYLRRDAVADKYSWSAKLLDVQGDTLSFETSLHYRINEKLQYSDIFTKIEAILNAFIDLIEDYSISDTTLEDVFLSYSNTEPSIADSRL